MPDISPEVITESVTTAINWVTGLVSFIGIGAFTHLKLENRNLRQDNEKLADDIVDCKGALSKEIKDHNAVVIKMLEKMDIKIEEKMVLSSKCKSNQLLFTERLNSANDIQTLQHEEIAKKLDKIFEVQEWRNK